MSATHEPEGGHRRVAGASSRSDRAFAAIGAGAAITLGVLVLVMTGAVVIVAWPSIVTIRGAFLSSTLWDPSRAELGALSFVWGTLVTSVIALLIAVPIGLGVSVFLTDLGPKRLQGRISILVELLSAIPSVVYGLWAAVALAPLLRTVVEPALGDRVGGPLFRGPYLGIGVLCASLILAIMVLPTIASISRDVISAVPAELREGALALGATPWDVVRLVVLPHAKRGIFGAVLLGFGRAVGETMAVAAVIGSRAAVSASLFSPGYTMSSVIANEFPVASDELHIAALAEIGLLLFFTTFVFNVIARVLVRRATPPRFVARAAGVTT